MIENMQEPVVLGDMPAAPAVSHGGAAENMLQIVWRQRWLVAAATGIVFSLAVIYLLIATPKYTSRASLYLDQPASTLTGQRAGSSDEAVTHRRTQGELLTTGPILADALLRADAAQMKTLASVDDSIAFLQSELTVDVGRKSNILTVALDSPYSDEATKLVQGVVDAYLAHTAGHNKSTAGNMLVALQDEQKTRDSEYQALVEQIQDYQRQHEIHAVENPEQVNERLGVLSNALTNAQMARVEAEAAYNVERAVLAEPNGVAQLVEAKILDGTSSSDTEYRQLQEDLHALQRNLAGLRRRWGSNHKLVKEGETSAAFLAQRLNEKRTRMTAAHLAQLYRRVITTRSAEQQVQAEYDRHRKQAAQTNSLAIALRRMQNDLAQLENRREELNSRIQELSVEKSTASIAVSLLEPAHALSKASWPRPGQVLGLGLCGGFALGLVLAMIRDWMDSRYRNAAQIRDALGAAVISTIPPIEGDDSPTARGQVVQLDPSCPASEAYRDIRTAIFFSRKARDLKTLLITSAGENDGKSTVASNLAITIAQTGRKVLLVDTDMRQATQHEIFRVKNNIGLSNILAGDTELDDAIRRTAISNLDLLAAGPAPGNPSELLNGDNMTTLLEQVREDYDYVILDSPPVAAVTDGRIIAATCDATVMVIRPSQGNRKVCEMAAQSLNNVGANVMGVVVNDTNRRFDNPAQHYYGSYGKSSKSKLAPTPVDSEPVTVRLLETPDMPTEPEPMPQPTFVNLNMGSA